MDSGTSRKGDGNMGKYLFQGNYVGDGVAGLAREGGSSRRAAAQAAMASVGGSVDAFYYAFGDVDIYGIADLPDDASAVAVSLLVNASGAENLKLTPLMEAEVLDDAAERSPDYRAPGS